MVRVLRTICALALAACASVAAHADESFDVRLSPAPRDALIKSKIGGHGAARVAVRGRTLTISGSFEGLPAAASRAELRLSPAVAVRGPAIRELTVTAATSGTLAGEITLDDAELEALAAGQLYIQINSELAPDGSVWGWLLPADAPVIRDP